MWSLRMVFQWIRVKIKAVVKWARPTNVNEVSSFLELAGYYKKFVEGFSNLDAPLMKQTRKNEKF